MEADTLKSVVAFGIGVVQGYLALPTIVLQEVWRQRLTSLFKRPLPFTQGFTTLVMLTFLLLLHGTVAVTLLDLLSTAAHADRVQLGKVWGLGAFVGVVVYSVIPAVENKIGHRRVKRQKRGRRD